MYGKKYHHDIYIYIYIYMTGFGKTDWPYRDYCWFELWAKYTLDWLTFAFLLALKWCLYELVLVQTKSFFCPLILPLITCNGEMLTWCYGNNSGSMSVSVLQLACSHDQTALQVALLVHSSKKTVELLSTVSKPFNTNSDRRWVCPQVAWLQAPT